MKKKIAYSPSKVKLKIEEIDEKDEVKKEVNDKKIKTKIKKKKAVGDPKLSELIKIYEL